MKEYQAKRVLIMVAVEAEREAIVRGLGDTARFDVRVAGVGPVAAAVRTAQALAAAEYRLVISAGIGGGFPGRAEVGSLVVASDILAADLGAETAEGYCSVEKLGFGSSRVPVDAVLVQKVTEAMRTAGLTVTTGPVLTLSTVTGTAATASELADRVPGAVAEAMEGFGVAFAAHDRGLPVLEIRAISNAVGPRDKSAWRMKEAFAALQAASAVLVEVL
ncbi:futalosine hydrolase [Tumebacillus algifaecis]|uniref:Futalosine hydrolase n=1 Tax=Tumebacillus algifaecis TaxID=1214604 RepID=A0A223D4W2_9BACL|nr:futalosine hydrolase [Tumebacillus algifaecis]ASS76659.1 futalosine hydrolase [Tumebacillus algifaecis]